MAGELRSLLSTGAATAGLALPVAMMVMAKSDGLLQPAEKELHRALLYNIAQDDDAAAQFERLTRNRSALLEALATADAPEMRSGIVEALALMTAYDGEVSEAETEFLTEVATHLGVAVDLDALVRQAAGYRGAPAGDGAMARAWGAAERGVPTGDIGKIA